MSSGRDPCDAAGFTGMVGDWVGEVPAPDRWDWVRGNGGVMGVCTLGGEAGVRGLAEGEKGLALGFRCLGGSGLSRVRVVEGGVEG